MKHLLPISGKDSLTTALIQMQRQPALEYDLFYNDTGMELPETYAWIKKVEAYIGKPIQFIGESLEDIIFEQGILPSQKSRYCTRMAKIIPMENWIGTKDKACVYYGIRADERRVGYKPFSNKYKITPVYPLVEEGYTLARVWSYLEDIDLLPPQFFWADLYDRVIKNLSAYLAWFHLEQPEDFLTKFRPWERAMMFAGRSRPNCHMCFNQRQYEIVWLADAHPELFEQDAQLEEEVGARTVDMNTGLWVDETMSPGHYTFTLNGSHSLRQIAQFGESVKQQRANDITKLILKRWNGEIVETTDTRDVLNVVSCGLFCGK